MPQIPESTISNLTAITREQLSGSDLLLLENATDDFKLSLSVLSQYLNLSGIGALSDIFNIYGAKNLLPYPYSFTSVTTTQSGITFTDHGDGSITLNGTASANIDLTLVTGLVLDGEYIVSTENYISNSSCLYLKTGSTVVDITESTTLSLSGVYEVGIKIALGEVITSVRLYPMIRLSSVEDFEFVPFAKTNKSLTNDKAENTMISDNVESTTVATRQHIVGEYIIYGNKMQFAKVTNAIEIGDVIVNGTNVANRTVAQMFAEIQSTLVEMQTTFTVGVNAIYNAIVAQGVTPSASTPTACATAIGTVATNKYDAGKAAAEAVTWTEKIYGSEYDSSYGSRNVFLAIPYKNVTGITNKSGGTITIEWENSSGNTVTQQLENNKSLSTPSNVRYNATDGIYWRAYRTVTTSSSSPVAIVALLVTFQAKILR